MAVIRIGLVLVVIMILLGVCFGMGLISNKAAPGSSARVDPTATPVLDSEGVVAVEAIKAIKDVSIQSQQDMKDVSITSIKAVTTTAVAGELSSSLVAIAFVVVIFVGLILLVSVGKKAG